MIQVKIKLRKDQCVIFTITFLLISLLFLLGCAREIKLYPSETKISPFKVATLEIWNYYGDLELEVDKQPVKWENGYIRRIYIRILPGKHELKWKRKEVTSDRLLDGREVKSEVDCSGSGILDAKEGKLYDFHLAIQMGRDLGYIGESAHYIHTTYRRFEVKDTATWIEEKYHPSGPKVVLGNKPNWVDLHTCEICGKEKSAAPYEYGCFKCRSKQYDQISTNPSKPIEKAKPAVQVANEAKEIHEKRPFKSDLKTKLTLDLEYEDPNQPFIDLPSKNKLSAYQYGEIKKLLEYSGFKVISDYNEIFDVFMTVKMKATPLGKKYNIPPMGKFIYTGGKVDGIIKIKIGYNEWSQNFSELNDPKAFISFPENGRSLLNPFGYPEYDIYDIFYSIWGADPLIKTIENGRKDTSLTVLKRKTQQDFGYDVIKWRQWLDKTKGNQ